MERLGMIIAAVVLDLCFGDPYWLYHPVQLIGKAISKGKKCIQRICSREHGVQAKKEILCGSMLTIIIVAGTYGITAAVLKAAAFVHPFLGKGLAVFWAYQILAAKCLKVESNKVYEDLKKKDLAKARISISYLVGRDTASLSEEEVAKACVETVAENTTDGVIAPLFYLFLGGVPLAMAYKAANTLDSMVGYRNDEFEYIGKASAKFDDVANYIPARLAAWTMILGSLLTGFQTKNAIRVYRKDRKAHLSPNCAQTEAVAAGALGIQLGGTHDYFGKPVEKPAIGEALQTCTAEQIRQAQTLMMSSLMVSLILFGGVYYWLG